MCVVLHACLLDGSVHHRHCFVVWFQKPGFTLVLLYHHFVLFYWPFFCTLCPSGFCSACKPWLSSLFCPPPQMSGYSRSSHAVVLLVLFVCSCAHTLTHTKAPHLHPLMPFSGFFPPFLHSSLLPKDKESGVSTSSGVWGAGFKGRRESAMGFFGSVAMNSTQ